MKMVRAEGWGRSFVAPTAAEHTRARPRVMRDRNSSELPAAPTPRGHTPIAPESHAALAGPNDPCHGGRPPVALTADRRPAPGGSLPPSRARCRAHSYPAAWPERGLSWCVNRCKGHGAAVHRSDCGRERCQAHAWPPCSRSKQGNKTALVRHRQGTGKAGNTVWGAVSGLVSCSFERRRQGRSVGPGVCCRQLALLAGQEGLALSNLPHSLRTPAQVSRPRCCRCPSPPPPRRVSPPRPAWWRAAVTGSDRSWSARVGAAPPETRGPGLGWVGGWGGDRFFVFPA